MKTKTYPLLDFVIAFKNACKEKNESQTFDDFLTVCMSFFTKMPNTEYTQYREEFSHIMETYKQTGTFDDLMKLPIILFSMLEVKSTFPDIMGDFYMNAIADKDEKVFLAPYYGMTQYGGANNSGVLFQFDPATSIYTKKIDLIFAIGSQPFGSLIQASDGILYGMTQYGGANSVGVIFQYDPVANTYTKKIDLISATGAYPHGSLMQASDGKLYGMTYQGGTNNFGVIFQYDPALSTYTKKIDFAGATNGSYPEGSLMQASDGKFYGMTRAGGANGMGVLFQFDPVSSIYIKKIDFLGAGSGDEPYGSLMQANDGLLYGMTYYGGGNTGAGVLFQYDPIANTYIKKIDLNYAANGSAPYGSLMQATDAKLYGMTNQGGANNFGVIFQYDPLTNTYTDKIDFSSSSGSDPEGSLVQANDGKLYGMTYDGGANSYGVIFQYDPFTNIYTDKIDLTIANGYYPYGSLMQANDGKLYGMTYQGGANGVGVIFQYDPLANIYTKKIDLSSANGSQPYGSLMQASDGKLYGMTYLGGANNAGVIFQYDPLANIYTKKIDLISTTGGNPRGSLLQASDGKLYGMTYIGGANNAGAIFQYDPSSNTYTKKIDLSALNGEYPYGSLLQASNGKLYGMTSQGGVNNFGVIFQYDPAISTYTKTLDFNGTNGKNPQYTNLIELASITTSAVIVSNCAGSAINVSYTIGGTYYAGNVFTAQLSDAAGSFTSPVIIGTYTATTAGTISAIIPSNTNTGTGYRIRVTGSSPVVTGSNNGSNIIIYALPSVTANASPSTTVCVGSSVTLAGGGATSYLWTGSVTNGIGFIPSSTNTYTVTGTDAHSCTNTSTISITQPTAITASTTVTNTICSNSTGTASVVASGGTGSFTYSWNPSGQTTTTATGLGVGNFTCTITDVNGCTHTETANILNTNGPTATISSQTNLLCNGNNNGTASISVSGGSFPYTYSWTNGQTTSSVTGLSAGTYSVTVYDSTGCSNIQTITITQPLAITNSMSITNASLCSASDGSATANISGGTTPYYYVWNNGKTTAVITGLAQGSYTLTVTDTHSCTNTFTATVGCTTGTMALSRQNDFAIYPNPNNGAFTIATKEIEFGIVISNIIGEKIYSSIINSQSTIVNFDAPNGIYFLNIKTAQGISTKKLIINK